MLDISLFSGPIIVEPNVNMLITWVSCVCACRCKEGGHLEGYNAYSLSFITPSIIRGPSNMILCSHLNILLSFFPRVHFALSSHTWDPLEAILGS